MARVMTLALLCLTVAIWPNKAFAQLSVTAPITENNGKIACDTCVTETSPTQYNLPVWATDQELATIAPSSQTTYPLFSAGSGANPAFRAIAIGDIPFLKGTANQTTVVSSTSAATTPNNCAKWDTDGNLVDSGGTCGGSGLTATVIDFSPMTQLTVLAATPVYCGLDGSCSTTTNGTDVQTPIYGTGTLDNIYCTTVGGTTNAVTVEAFSGTCNGALATGNAKNVMSATAWAVGTPSGSTSWTTGQCIIFKFTAGTNADKAAFRCTVKQSAGT